MKNQSFGYLENADNRLGIFKARTLLGNLRLWEIPKNKEVLDIVINEIGYSVIPGIYLLFDDRSEKKVYVGQSENLKSRITTLINTPNDKIKNWERAIIINDARNATQSDLNDESIRIVLRNYLTKLLKIRRYKVIMPGTRMPSLCSTQIILTNSFKKELNFLLTKKFNPCRKLKTQALPD